MLICNKSRECTFPMGCPHKEKHDKSFLCELVGCDFPGGMHIPDMHIESRCIEVLKC